jgi:hypothetical protein
MRCNALVLFLFSFTWYLSKRIPWNKFCLSSGFRCGVRSSLFWDVTQCPIFKGQAVQAGPWPFKIEPIGCPETSVTKYQRTLRNIAEVRRYSTSRCYNRPRRRPVSVQSSSVWYLQPLSLESWLRIPFGAWLRIHLSPTSPLCKARL